MKVQIHNSSEPPLQSGPYAFAESRLVMIFLTSFGVPEILCSFRLVLEGKAGKEIPESSRLELLEMLLVKSQTILLYQMQKATPQYH